MSKDGDTDKSVVVVFQDKQLLPNREAALKSDHHFRKGFLPSRLRYYIIL